MPSSHFGALSFPSFDEHFELSLSLDRFTDSTKKIDYLDPRRTRKYALRHTMGLNFLALSMTHRWRRIGGMSRATLGAGYLNDEPTQYLQNNFLHDFDEIERIPNDRALEPQALWSAGLEHNWWFDNNARLGSRFRLIAPIFIGLGGGASSMHHEVFVQAGIRSTSFRILGASMPRPAVMLRAAPKVWSSALLHGETHARAYQAVTASVHVPVDEWWDGRGFIPSVEFGTTSSSGLFLSPRTEETEFEALRVAERFCSVALSWGRGVFRAETYNDSCGNKDQGPTFGVRIWRRFGRITR